MRALNLGLEPNEQSIRWLGVAQAAVGTFVLVLWTFGPIG